MHDHPANLNRHSALTRRVAPLRQAPLCKRYLDSGAGQAAGPALPDRSDEPRASCPPTGGQPARAPGDRSIGGFFAWRFPGFVECCVLRGRPIPFAERGGGCPADALRAQGRGIHPPIEFRRGFGQGRERIPARIGARLDSRTSRQKDGEATRSLTVASPPGCPKGTPPGNHPPKPQNWLTALGGTRSLPKPPPSEPPPPEPPPSEPPPQPPPSRKGWGTRADVDAGFVGRAVGDYYEGAE